MRATLLRTAPAAVVLALAVGVSGASGAVAAKMITGKQIKDGSLTGADIRNGSLTGLDVKNGSIGTEDTAAALDEYEQRIGSFSTVSETSPVAAGGGGSVTATCPAGLSLIGGFAWWKNQNTGTQVEYHAPAGGKPQYAVAYSTNVNGSDDTLLITITCGATTS